MENRRGSAAIEYTTNDYFHGLAWKIKRRKGLREREKEVRPIGQEKRLVAIATNCKCERVAPPNQPIRWVVWNDRQKEKREERSKEGEIMGFEESADSERWGESTRKGEREGLIEYCYCHRAWRVFGKSEAGKVVGVKVPLGIGWTIAHESERLSQRIKERMKHEKGQRKTNEEIVCLGVPITLIFYLSRESPLRSSFPSKTHSLLTGTSVYGNWV